MCQIPRDGIQDAFREEILETLKTAEREKTADALLLEFSTPVELNDAMRERKELLEIAGARPSDALYTPPVNEKGPGETAISPPV